MTLSHERFLKLGKTVAPMRIENIKEIVGIPVDESYGTYTVWNTPNSADLTFGRISDRGYMDIRGNPNWVYQFHPDEWSLIEDKLDESPFVDDFGHDIRVIVSEKNWDKAFQSRYEKTRGGY